MDVADIKDKESLETWLESWPTGTKAEEDHARKVAVQIAHRAAMRVLPRFWAWAVESRDRDVTGFKILRCSVIAGVAGKCPTPAIRPATDAAAVDAAYAAANVSNAAANVSNAAASDAANAAYVSANAFYFSAAAFAFAASSAAFSARPTTADIWPHIRQDAATLRDGGDAMDLPLWHDDASPLAKDWQKIKDHYGNDPQWKFWIDWYESALQGHPQNWDMLTEIALIKPKIWDQGPDTVNPVIMGIVEKFRLRDEIAALKKELASTVTVGATTEHRSHNQPPELVDTPAEVKRELTIIWAHLDEAEEETAKPDPSPARLQQIGQAILQASGAIVKYCAGLCDTALQSGAEELGKSGTKWALRVGGLALASQTEAAQSIGRALIELAKMMP